VGDEAYRQAKRECALHRSRPRQLVELVAEGERNDRITKLFGHVYGALRPDRVVLYHLVHAWNKMNCDPPLSGEEVLRIAESINGRETKKRVA